MSTRAQKIRLGVFMLLAVLMLAGSVVTLAGMKLWNPKDRFYVRFAESISGLEIGSTVKMKGVRVGQVEKIKIDKDVESVLVTLSLEPGTPIPRDVTAVMTSIGITGLQFIELTGGTATSKRIPPNTPKSFIQPGQSVLESLTGAATDIAFKTEGLLNNLLLLTAEDNRVRVNRLLDNADKLVVTLEDLASSNKERIARILGNVDRTSKSLAKASVSVSRLAEESAGELKRTLEATTAAAGSVQRVVAGINPQKTLTSITSAADSLRDRVADKSIDKAVANLSSAAAHLSNLSAELSKVVGQRDRQLGTIMANLDRAAEYLKQFSRSIKERPSLLLRGETLKERDVP